MIIEPTPRATGRQALRIEWFDSGGPLPVIFFCDKAASVQICGAAGRVGRRGLISPLRVRRASRGRRGFTLLELLVVLAIIGIMASMTLPHLSGFSKANAMSVATRQLLDDVSYARQRAMVNRSMVYMVFVPPQPWLYMSNLVVQGRGMSNLISGQYRSYALVTLRSVGDQPGGGHPSFLTDWKSLPNGVFIATNEYVPLNSQAQVHYVRTTNTLAGTVNQFDVFPFTNSTRSLPFPTLQLSSYDLPYIAFSPNGSLVDERGNPVPDQYIPLTTGGIFYPSDAQGGLLRQEPLISENAPGEWTNNPNLIHIDATTARAKLERNQF
ncbi:MAG TPA: prepilin-type N-terminal cleavage/methylation domain-containing protein [Verrucomicrobiae bacterium]|jgi:prepilin-type N-terminal cleavage/methylation domain-containing protein|nr:prepilin-type N-terminal cleavage/methylation domain-containing protein [Verrucomicrobiae bacterium]